MRVAFNSSSLNFHAQSVRDSIHVSVIRCHFRDVQNVGVGIADVAQFGHVLATH